MRVDTEQLGRYYASLSDGEFLNIERGELTEAAQKVYDGETARRRVTAPSAARPSAPVLAGNVDDDAVEAAEWLDDGVCACSFAVLPDGSSAQHAAEAEAALQHAGISCKVTLAQGDERAEHCLMVPGGLLFHAIGILDRDYFNAQQEDGWRSYFADLPDEEFAALDPEIMCAGMLDRAARLERVYREELARRDSELRQD